jgi:hypothetical protein
MDICYIKQFNVRQIFTLAATADRRKEESSRSRPREQIDLPNDDGFPTIHPSYLEPSFQWRLCVVQHVWIGTLFLFIEIPSLLLSSLGYPAKSLSRYLRAAVRADQQAKVLTSNPYATNDEVARGPDSSRRFPAFWFDLHSCLL